MDNEIMKKEILFICVQNSARSQIVAALLNRECGDYFQGWSYENKKSPGPFEKPDAPASRTVSETIFLGGIISLGCIT